jgi:hypothetical protein
VTVTQWGETTKTQKSFSAQEGRNKISRRKTKYFSIASYLVEIIFMPTENGGGEDGKKWKWNGCQFRSKKRRGVRQQVFFFPLI